VTLSNFYYLSWDKTDQGKLHLVYA